MSDDGDPRTTDSSDMITMSERRRARRRLTHPAALAGVAIVALAGGAGAGYAATHSFGTKAADTATAVAPAATPTPSASAPAGPGWRGRGGGGGRFSGRGFGGFFGGFGTKGGIVHGQVVVPKSGGGYQTLDVQRGQVTAVSSTSITVKSADGYTAGYAVTGSTTVDAKPAGIGSVRTGDTVLVTATVSGSTATAANIVDPTAIRAGRASFGFPTAPPSPPASAAANPAS